MIHVEVLIKDKYEFKNKFDSMTGGSLDPEMGKISSKCKREYRTYTGKKKRMQEDVKKLGGQQGILQKASEIGC